MYFCITFFCYVFILQGLELDVYVTLSKCFFFVTFFPQEFND